MKAAARIHGHPKPHRASRKTLAAAWTQKILLPHPAIKEHQYRQDTDATENITKAGGNRVTVSAIIEECDSTDRNNTDNESDAA